MSVANLRDYWELNYFMDNGKEEVVTLLREGFVTGLLNASNVKKTVNMTTHKWMIKNVVNDSRLQECLVIEIKKCKRTLKLKSEILMLLSLDTLIKNKCEVKRITSRERTKYKVYLRRKKNE